MPSWTPESTGQPGPLVRIELTSKSVVGHKGLSGELLVLELPSSQTINPHVQQQSYAQRGHEPILHQAVFTHLLDLLARGLRAID